MAWCVKADIEQQFGPDNVADWADLDNDDNATKIANRIAAAITYAEAFAKAMLRGSPLSLTRIDASVPTLITVATAIIAGVYLYECRGLEDASPNPDGSPRHRLASAKASALQTLEMIRDGKLEIEV